MQISSRPSPSPLSLSLVFFSCLKVCKMNSPHTKYISATKLPEWEIFLCLLHCSRSLTTESTSGKNSLLKYFIIWLCRNDKKHTQWKRVPWYLFEEKLRGRKTVLCCYFAVELMRFSVDEFSREMSARTMLQGTKCNLKLAFFCRRRDRLCNVISWRVRVHFWLDAVFSSTPRRRVCTLIDSWSDKVRILVQREREKSDNV